MAPGVSDDVRRAASADRFITRMQPPDPADVQRAIGDRYALLSPVGAGGMGFVYTARHRTLGHIVAVKVLPPEVAASEMRLRRFQQEAALAASLSHPHIVPVYDFGSRDGITFLIMPFVRGASFERVLAQSRPTLEQSLRVAREVGAALDHAHGRGVVHRDVKPANILIDEDTGRALLTDFGVAHVVRAATGSLTAPGVPIGTPGYMAPEQEAGSERLDGRADLYSLAVVTFEALTGTRPASGTDLATLGRSLRGARPELAAAVAGALVAPLFHEPDQRPVTAAAWLAGVGRARAQLRRRWGAAGVIAVALLAALGWALCRAHVLGWCRPPRVVIVAVMPFDKLGGQTLPARELMEAFARRLAAAPRLVVLSGGRVYTEAVRRYGAGPLSNPDADSLAEELGATYFVQPSLEFTGPRVRLTARLYRHHTDGAVGDFTIAGSIDSLADLMTAVGEGALRPILGRAGGLGPGRTCPVGFVACAAYLKADEAFRRGDYEQAAALYNEVITRAPDFAPAYFGRLLVVGQANPTEATLRQAIAGARQHSTGLERTDSLLLTGYVTLLQQGDGRRALEDFQLAARAAPDQPYVHFVLGEFYFFFGALFEQRITSAKPEYDSVLALDPKFAPAVANSIPLAHLSGDDDEVRRLIDLYRTIDTTSVVAELVRIADTVIFRPADALRLLNPTTLERRRLPVLEFLAFQAAQFATPADSALKAYATRGAMRALERRAATEYERALALRWGVAAQLAAAHPDSARARVARAAPGSAAREADAWIALAHALQLDSLGDWEAALNRLTAWSASRAGAGDAAAHWILARAGRDPSTHAAALRRLARPDSAPLPVSLSLDLDARARLAAADTAGALELWDRATRRYAVLSAPFDLLGSLWPLRLDLARVATARGDSTRARAACGSFDALAGYVDQVALARVAAACRRPGAPGRGG
jgi:TolB-like protein